MIFKKIGKSLMLPVAFLPIAAILNGIGYSLEQLHNPNIYFLAVILKTTGSIILSNMPMTFAVGISYGLSKEHNGLSAINGLFAFIIITTLLSSTNIAVYQHISLSEVPIAFEKIDNQFIGILSGVIAASCYNYSIRKKPAVIHQNLLIFLSTTVVMFLISIGLYYLWPLLFQLLIEFGLLISKLGPIGAGIYAFFNRLLISLGMHHALNSVFWFDVIGINDIGNFWSSTGTYGVTGMYQAGFFPIMMFGLPAVALAMIKTAYPKNRKKVASFLLSAAFASFFTGITEPLEFAFMFIAPPLYLLHAVLTGVCVFIAAQFEWIAGFSFSAGFIDYLLSYNMPFSKQPLMLIVLGIFIGIIYYFTFVYVIKKFNMHTIGRETIAITHTLAVTLSKEEALRIARILVLSCGGWQNIKDMECCISRLRMQLYDTSLFHFEAIKEVGAIEFLKLQDEIQIVFGPQANYILEMLEEIKDT